MEALESSMQVGSEDFAPPAHLESIKELLADRNKRVDLLYHVILNASEGTRRGLLSDMQCLEMRSVAERFKKEKQLSFDPAGAAFVTPKAKATLQQAVPADAHAPTSTVTPGGASDEEDLWE